MANQTGNTEYQWSSEDLKDPTLWRVNSTLTSVNSRLSTLESEVSSIQASIASLTANASSASGGAATSIVTVHASRNSFSAANYNIGSFLTETDRNSIYQVRLVLNKKAWVFLAGIMRGTTISSDLRPADLKSNDTGFMFFSTDADLLYRWSGTVWVLQSDYQPILSDTHSSRLASYPSTRYAVGQEFLETDRTTSYWVQNASGTVTVTGGTTVTWVSGSKFINTGSGFSAAQWPAGTVIVINGVACSIFGLGSPTTLILQNPTTNAVNVSYFVASGLWVYLRGQYADISANIPADLGENDYQIIDSGSGASIGFRFFDTNHWRLFEWAETGGLPSASSPGWRRGPGELPTGALQILPFGGGQISSGWSLCNGTTVNITQDDSTTLSVTLPNFIGAFPKGSGSGSYTGAVVAPTLPTIGGKTETATTGISVSGSSGASAGTGTVDAGMGAPVSVLTPPFDGGGGGGGVTDPGHFHNLTSADAPITLPGDPVAAILVPLYMKR